MSKNRWYLKSLACVLFATLNVSPAAYGESCASSNPNECYGSEAYWDYKRPASNENIGINFGGDNTIMPASLAVDKYGEPVYSLSTTLSIGINSNYWASGVQNVVGGTASSNHYIDRVEIEARRQGDSSWQQVKVIRSGLECAYSFENVIPGVGSEGTESCFENPSAALKAVYGFNVNDPGVYISFSVSEAQNLLQVIGAHEDDGTYPAIEFRASAYSNENEADVFVGTRTVRVGNAGIDSQRNGVDYTVPHANIRHDRNKILFNDPSEANAAERETVGYLGDWSVYGRGLNGAGLDFDNYDWIVHSFLGICSEEARNEVESGINAPVDSRLGPEFAYALNFYNKCHEEDEADGTIKLNDTWAWSGKTLQAPDGSVVMGLKGLYEWSKDNDKPVDFGVSLGGWTLSHAFKYLENPLKRQNFIDSLETFLQENPFVTGVDVDWEWQQNEQEGALFITLMSEVRNLLDRFEADTGLNYRLSTAVFSTANVVKNIDMKALNEVADAVYIMSYDFSGPWGKNVGFHTNTFTQDQIPAPSEGDLIEDEEHSVATAVRRFLNLGISNEKLFLGVAHYGRAMQLCSMADITSVSPLAGSSCYDSYSDRLSVGTKESGVVEYWSFHEMYDPANSNLTTTYENVAVGETTYNNVETVNGFSYFSDHLRNADYFVNPSKGIYFDMETPRTICNKAQIVKQFNLGGSLAWAVEYDNHRLQNAYKYCLGDEPVNALDQAALASDVEKHGTSLTSLPTGFDWNDIDSQFKHSGTLFHVTADNYERKRISTKRYTDKTRWFFVVEDKQVGPTKPVWHRKGYSKLKVPALDSNGNQVTINLRGTRLIKRYRRMHMNTGVNLRGKTVESFELEFNPNDNRHLAPGQTYQSVDTLKVNAWPWKDWRMRNEPGFSLEYNIVIDVPQ